MSRVRSAKAVIAVAVALASHEAVADPLIVEGVPLAKRTVPVDLAALSGDPAASARLDARLHAAAKAVCREEYRSDSVNFSHACIAGTYDSAIEELGQLRASQPATHAASGKAVAITVQAR